MSMDDISIYLVRFNVACSFISELYGLAMSLRDPASEDTRMKFKVRFTDIARMRDQFDETFAYIVAATEDEKAKAEFDGRFRKFYEMYYMINTVYTEVVCASTPQTSSPVGAQASGLSRSSESKHYLLPKLGLIRFNGTHTEWPNFISIFNSLVHNSMELSNVNKFHFLLDVLDQEPLGLVRHLTISEENYVVAYTLLQQRYENKRLIADKHLESLLSGSCPALVYKNLRKFVNNLKENTQALISLGFDVASWSFLLFHLISRKMPSELRTKFEFTLDANEIPDFNKLLAFLEKHLRVLETTSNMKVTPSVNTVVASSSIATTLHMAHTVCICCGEEHPLYHCKKFESMNDKRAFVKSKNLCFNCLRPHHVSKCTSSRTCQVCRGRHHTKLHIAVSTSTPAPSTGASVPPPIQTTGSANPSVGTVSAELASTSTALPVLDAAANILNVNSEPWSAGLLGTALVGVQDISGQTHVVRALIDPGAQVCLMTECLAQRLRLPRRKSCELYGVGEHKQATQGMVACRITSLIETSHPGLSADAVILRRITGYQSLSQVSSLVTEKCENLVLADTTFNMPGRIDILLGVGLFDDIFNGPKRKLGQGLPTAHSTIFGWVLMGHSPMTSMNYQSVHTLNCNSSLELALNRFWESEEVPSAPVPDPEDIACEKHFAETHSRDENGRFIVRLPFKVEQKQLGDTRHAALKRFHNLERKLVKEPRLRELYVEFMRDYKETGHMQLRAPDAVGERCYIPHHGVLKESSSTTKLRAVFDASLSSSTGVSLNQNLMSGPKLQQNIQDIILRFRLHSVVFTCDIKQMYRNVRMHPEDHRYQTIFWRESPEEPLEEFELTTVTYGVSSSAYQAIRVIHQLAKLNADASPDASRVLREDIFVDDIVSGSGSLEDAKVLQQQIVDILGQGCFQLRKWSSNRGELLDGFPSDHRETPFRFEESGDNVFKILGIEWNPSSDSFLYRVAEMTRANTKRGILSNIARLYDPCGFITPVTFLAKSFMQSLWLVNLEWDDPLPSDALESWLKFADDFKALNQIRIPRFVLTDQPLECHIHGFSDASERGYAACVYLLTKCAEGSKVHLILSKSRLAPVSQKLTVPRLELAGAVLLARLLEHVFKILSEKIRIDTSTAWCDSTIVLSWLETSPHRLQTYEGNRVSQVRGIIPNVPWKHVPSSMNPADCASRGLLPTELLTHSLWWGPEWILTYVPVAALPAQAVELPIIDAPFVAQPVPNVELASSNMTSPVEPYALAAAVDDCDLLARFSRLTKLLTTVGWCLRFVNNARQPSHKSQLPHLTVKELDDALLKCVRLVQGDVFSDVIHKLRHNKSIKGSLVRLHPFIDDSGLLRVGGRLVNSNLPYDGKHPVLLPHSHPFTHLVVDHYHLLFGHPGATILRAILQRRFWILSAGRVVKDRIFKCQRCYILKAKPLTPFMGNLPASRVNQSRPFQKVGVDFAGPFTVRASILRTPRTHKAYLSVFICFATKAVHLEVVSELSTNAFLACLDRFMARRGLPSDIYSDCGTNFVGARNHLKQIYETLDDSAVQKRLISQEISWHLNVPSGPHHGGLWENAVKSCKTLLTRIIGERTLTFEELSTVFSKVEAIINSRPLCPLSSDPNDLEVLTPGHFIIGQPLLCAPEQNLEQVPASRLNRWQMLQQITQHFWNRWHSEYLHTLQQRNRWLRPQPNLQVGDLVLLIEPNASPLEWRRARVTRICPGTDGIVRVVEIATARGNLLRPVVKLCPLFPDH